MKTSAAQKSARRAKRRRFYKLDCACRQSKQDGFRYIWNDTCCINKESSAELQEAINSMFQWYKDATVCYAYLSDLPGGFVSRFREEHRWHGTLTALQHFGEDYTNGNGSSGTRGSHLSMSTRHSIPPLQDIKMNDLYVGELEAALKRRRWFTRGWTLQELIAPNIVQFFDSEWRPIGYKSSLQNILVKITRIDAAVLQSSKVLARRSIATRMSWASARSTARVEDQAYCLLGLFDINMPMLYGEGSKAFIRLQEEIIKTSMDQSIFAWDDTANDGPPAYPIAAGGDAINRTQFWGAHSLLAPNPSCFKEVAHLQYSAHPGYSAYVLNNKGLSIVLPIVGEKEYKSGVPDVVASLNCSEGTTGPNTLLLLRSQESQGPTRQLQAPESRHVYYIHRGEAGTREDHQKRLSQHLSAKQPDVRYVSLTILRSRIDTFEFFH